VDVSSSLWGSDLLLTDPKPIIDVHQGYIDAGADLVESSTYVTFLKELMTVTHYQSNQSYVNTLANQPQKQKISYILAY
jgi:S-methylmethionine-dependent homocysteine/selenocysteine methylase